VIRITDFAFRTPIAFLSPVIAGLEPAIHLRPGRRSTAAAWIAPAISDNLSLSPRALFTRQRCRRILDANAAAMP